VPQSILNQPKPSENTEMRHEQRCPHCGHELTLKQTITAMHGSGYEQYVHVRRSDGSIAIMEAGIVNPTTSEVLEDLTCVTDPPVVIKANPREI
jgi:hypothetical protein